MTLSRLTQDYQREPCVIFILTKMRNFYEIKDTNLMENFVFV